MPTIEEAQSKKPFKKRNQRPWDLMGDAGSEPATGDDAQRRTSFTLVSKGETPILEAAYVDIARVRPDPDQVRRQIDLDSQEMAELADSVRLHGIRQPLTVWRDGDSYEIVFGERRFHAAGRAGLKQVPCLILAEKPAADDKTVLQLVENLHRRDMSPLDEAQAYHRLATQHGLKQEEIAARVGRSRSDVTKTLRLMDLSDEVREKCATSHISGSKELSFEHMLEIARQPPEQQASLLDKIQRAGLSVRALREELREAPERQEQEREEKAPPSPPPSTRLYSHKFVDPEDNFWLMLHFKQAKVPPQDIQRALEKALADVKRAIARGKT